MRFGSMFITAVCVLFLLSSVSFPGQRFVVDGMICACLHVAGKIKMASNSRTMTIEIKYINSKNAVIHTENCKLMSWKW